MALTPFETKSRLFIFSLVLPQFCGRCAKNRRELLFFLTATEFDGVYRVFPTLGVISAWEVELKNSRGEGRVAFCPRKIILNGIKGSVLVEPLLILDQLFPVQTPGIAHAGHPVQQLVIQGL